MSLKNSDFYIKPSPYATSTSTVPVDPLIGQTNPVTEVSRNWTVTNADGLGNDTLTPYDGIKKFFVSNAVASVSSFTVSMELGSLPFNIFSLNKMMYFGSEQLVNKAEVPVTGWDK